MRRLLILVFLLCTAPFADAMSTSELKNYCNSKSDKDYSILMGYVIALADNSLIKNQLGNENICIPKGVYRREIVDRVCKYIELNPEAEDFLGISTVRRAFRQNFPCHEQGFKVGRLF